MAARRARRTEVLCRGNACDRNVDQGKEPLDAVSLGDDKHFVTSCLCGRRAREELGTVNNGLCLGPREVTHCGVGGAAPQRRLSSYEPRHPHPADSS